VAATGGRRRLDSKLESEGAEFLVLAHLLVEGIQATKAYTNFPGYDVLAFNPERDNVCRIQVKSRWATDYDRSFPIKNFDCDFVVHVALNRGYRGYGTRSAGAGSGRRPPRLHRQLEPRPRLPLARRGQARPLTSSVEQIRVECPACGSVYED
jgi:hypothetical protein